MTNIMADIGISTRMKPKVIYGIWYCHGKEEQTEVHQKTGKLSRLFETRDNELLPLGLLRDFLLRKASEVFIVNLQLEMKTNPNPKSQGEGFKENRPTL